MAVLSADAVSRPCYNVHDIPEGRIINLKVAASTVIYRGGFVGLNVTGYLVEYVKSTDSSAITGTRFMGIALEHIVSQTSDGDADCKVLVEGAFEGAVTVAVQDIGAPIYISDDNTLTLSAVGNQFIGWIENVRSTTHATIRLVGPGARLGNVQVEHFLSTIISVVTVNNLVQLIPPQHNGMLVLHAGALVTTTVVAATTEAVVTVENSTGADICTLTTVTGMVPDDWIAAQANKTAFQSATDQALTVLAAGVALQAKLTTAAADLAPAGAMKIVVAALPIA